MYSEEKIHRLKCKLETFFWFCENGKKWKFDFKGNDRISIFRTGEELIGDNQYSVYGNSISFLGGGICLYSISRDKIEIDIREDSYFLTKRGKRT